MRTLAKLLASLLATLSLLFSAGCGSKPDAPEVVYGPPEYFDGAEADVTE